MRRDRPVTIIEGEGWAYAFPTQRDAVRFRKQLDAPMLRTMLHALAFDHNALGSVAADGLLDPTFGGIVRHDVSREA